MTQANNSSDSFQVPAEEPFDTVGLQGSMQQILQDNIGNYVTVEFLIGTQSIVSRQGILYSVGTGFLVLYDDIQQIYQVCDIFAVKFATFYLPGHRPGQVTTTVNNTAAEETAAQPVFNRATQAAYAYVQAKNRK